MQIFLVSFDLLKKESSPNSKFDIHDYVIDNVISLEKGLFTL